MSVTFTSSSPSSLLLAHDQVDQIDNTSYNPESGLVNSLLKRHTAWINWATTNIENAENIFTINAADSTLKKVATLFFSIIPLLILSPVALIVDAYNWINENLVSSIKSNHQPTAPPELGEETNFVDTL